MSSTYHQAIALTSPSHVTQIELPTPVPGPTQVLVEVEYSALMALDTYITDFSFILNKEKDLPLPLGFSSSGYVSSVGGDVNDIRKGDRVTVVSLTPTEARTRATQQFVLVDQSVVAKIPDTLPLELACTLPDNFITAFYVLFNQLALPHPKQYPSTPTVTSGYDTPILIYGASSSAGLFCIQLLHCSGYTNIYAVSSDKHHDYLQSLGATYTFEYNNTQHMINNLINTNNGDKFKYIVDCISADDTLDNMARVLDEEHGQIAILLPIKEGNSIRTTGNMKWEPNDGVIPPNAKWLGIRTFLYQQDEYLKKNLMPKILPELLEKGLIQPNRIRLITEGRSWLERVEYGLDLLRNNQVSAEKVVIKVDKKTL